MSEFQVDVLAINVDLEAIAQERLVRFAESLQSLIAEATVGGAPTGLPELLELEAKNLRDLESNK